MATKVEICNLALLKVGSETSLASLDDPNKAARSCKAAYDISRRAVLRMHPWNFAVKRLTLSQSDTVPAWGSLLYFPLPGDYLRLLRLDDQDKIYKVEVMPTGQRAIITDESTINAKYIYDCVNETYFDSLFTLCLAQFVAVNIAYSITQSNDRVQELRDEFSKMMPRARHVDATEDYPDSIIADEVLNVRIGPNRGWVRDPQT